METIVMIKGKVDYQITLDPGVWIFDDRKVDLTTYFIQEQEIKDELEEYTKSVSKHWEREIREGAIYPPTLKSEQKYEKQKVLNGTFGIPLKPFLENAGIQAGASSVQFMTDSGPLSVPIEEAFDIILGFSIKGKPLKEDGPIHVYFGDGSNASEPIKHVKEINVI
ncbi:peptidyl-prolyl cis-trans isomerase [uncultured Metabacillus sp.]|uniref:peptidyl-prolyl cis-trans isomerase n=1 Tax=uncultured Metabacillus sp. TaxID=2860135 RepID=UPI002615E7F8|nr:peptidyl-prolyl cis-trans isomerase [uncultured Metabacillus sp.]